jgi:hypothetical protein
MIRDSYSKALLETDTAELQKYRREKSRDKEIVQIRRDIQHIIQSINRLNGIIQRREQEWQDQEQNK